MPLGEPFVGNGYEAPDIDRIPWNLPDAIALWEGSSIARECFGDEVVWVPWRRPGFQLGLGMALIVVVIAENFGTEWGLGYIVWHSWQIFEVGEMYVGLVMIALVGYASQLLMTRLERLFIPWKNR